MKKCRSILLLTMIVGTFQCMTVYAGYPNAAVAGVHAIGNGALCVYGRQADVLQIFGPPYSSPSMFEMTLQGDYAITSQRETGTAVWIHHLTKDLKPVALHTDFVTDRGCTFVRRTRNEQPLSYRIEIKLEDRYAAYDRQITVQREPVPTHIKDVKQCYRITIAPGVPFYSSYKAPAGYEYLLFVTGSLALEPEDGSLKKLTLKMRPGEGALYVVAGPDRKQLQQNVEWISSHSPSALLQDTKKSWKNYSSRQTRFKGKALRKTQQKEFLRAVDDIGVLIKSQQGVQGSVLAGSLYHMGYVRDQYGVSRALLALGHTEEARGILHFYFNVWQQNGYIKNAQAIGYPGIFHRHENDQSEITGYLVVQAFDYYRKTGDREFLCQILPMLEWATQVQCENIIDGMLPFNGDETYIAGGIVPRKVMYHGSAEATLLFIEGSNRLLDFVREQNLWDQNRIDTLTKYVTTCSDRYRTNFFRNGTLYLNNPEREKKVTYPTTRPGVCLYPGHMDYFPETFHYKGCLYFCKDCMNKAHEGVEIPPVELFTIPSAYLFPIYINAGLLSSKEKLELLDQMVDYYRQTGKISPVDRILGYDYGMFLYALSDCGYDFAAEVYDKMMALRDGAGAWVEYYVDGVPSGCRCRPWESGINIEAAVKYAR